ncbi:hypothetical protein [Albimonas pacifica]|uniref:Thymidylate kinase n=1 Tax=Albimonas pacifica TaxID=1114924 RepID=A0A1I3IXD8_9RHOB|nr:hypothetical protein [Albimonas pacifica]SFI52602.1 Thymidylate kinase [Albimonas pacifica]
MTDLYLDLPPPQARRGAAPERLPGDAPGAVRALVAGLAKRGVRFCHWKSNLRLAEAMAGAEDLDLLVRREDAGRLLAAAIEAGFRPAVSRGGMGHPGVIHAFALNDDASGLVHLHAYFGVVTGDSLVKCFRLPIEEDLLAGGHRLHGLPVPPPEAELALFALRVLLKHADLVEVAMVARGYDAVRRELRWLRGRADLSAAQTLWRRWLPAGDPPRLAEALAAIEAEGGRGRLERIRLGLRLSRALRDRRRIGHAAARFQRKLRVWRMLRNRRAGRRDLALQTGGLVVAMVGPKGVGKSTLGGEIARRLGRDLDMLRVHAGRPPATWLSFAPRLLTPLARRLFRSERTGEYEKPERRASGRWSLLFVLRMTLLAHDRRALLRRCWREAASGAIVVTDRYPSQTPGAIDSGVFDNAAVAAERSILKRWLMRREQALCRGVPGPQLVLRLEASPETAVRRDAARDKPGGPDADAVRRRWGMETCADFGAAPVAIIDTDRPLAASAEAAARAIWRAL